MSGDPYKVGSFLISPYESEYHGHDSPSGNHPYTLSEDGEVLNTDGFGQGVLDEFWNRQNDAIKNGYLPQTILGLAEQEGCYGFVITEFIHTHGVGGAYTADPGERVFFRTACVGYREIEGFAMYSEYPDDAMLVHRHIAYDVGMVLDSNKRWSSVGVDVPIGILRGARLCGFVPGSPEYMTIDSCPTKIPPS